MIASKIRRDVTFGEKVAQMTDNPDTNPPNVPSTRQFVLLVTRPANGAKNGIRELHKKHYSYFEMIWTYKIYSYTRVQIHIAPVLFSASLARLWRSS